MSRQFGSIDPATFQAMETNHEARLLAAHLEEYDGPEVSPEEAAAQAWLDERWGGDAA